MTITPSEVDAVAFAKAMADDTRQQIMKHLCCQWLSVNDTVQKLGGKVSQPTVSHHLKILEAADLVTVRQDGRQRFYTLNEENFTVCCDMLMANFAPTYAGSAPVPIIDTPQP
jgi:ArsR family transcriptional regulator